MKNGIKKMVMLTAAAVLLTGAASDVAYAHSGHHGQRKMAAVCYATCYQNGGCAQNGSCDVNGVCQNGGYCTGTPCHQDNALCSESHLAGRWHRSHH